MPLVRDGSLDFAIAERGFAPVEDGLVFRMLWQSELVIVARRGNPLAGATSLRQPTSVPWLMIYRPSAGGLLEQALAAAGLPPPNMRAHAICTPPPGADRSLIPVEDAEAGAVAGLLQGARVR